MSYRLAAVSAFGWQSVLKILSNVLVLVKIMILARLLSPVDFGVFSLVSIALGLTESVTQTGVNVTIVQSKHPVDYFIDTAWVIAIIRGFVISICMVVLGWGMSQYYQQPELLYLVALASVIPVVKGFINPAIIGLYKDLHFFTDSLYRFALVCGELVFTLLVVWTWPSVSSWIIGLVLAAGFEVMISFVFFKQKPVFAYMANRATLIFSQAKGLGLSSVVGYLNENVDNLLIGKLTGTYGLGLYQNTYALCHEPNYEITKSVHHGSLPIYSKLSTEPSRLKRGFYKTSFLSLGMILLASLPLLVMPEFVMSIVLGDKWLPAVPLVRWLVVAGLLQAVSMLCYSLFLSQKALKAMNIHQIMTFGLMVTLIWVLGSRYGLLGAVMGVVLSRALTLPYVIASTWLVLRKVSQPSV